MSALYSERNNRTRGFTYSDLVSQIWDAIKFEIYQKGLLDKKFGYTKSSWCPDEEEIDDNYVHGEYSDAKSYYTRKLRYRVDFDYDNYGSRGGFKNGDPAFSTNSAPQSFNDKDKFFDFLELLWQDVSLPIRRESAKKHIGFSQQKGRNVLRELLNQDLVLYEKPMTMLANGQIIELESEVVAEMANRALSMDLSNFDTVSEPLNAGIEQFLSRNATVSQKKAGLKSLADALEAIRPKVKKQLLTKDEGDLFNILNNFTIRHNDKNQKNDYNQEIWYRWMFHVCLAALMTTIELVNSQEEK